VGVLILRSSLSDEPATFDFYISPTGSDSNDGLTTSTPWAITAINTKQATYSPTTMTGDVRIGLMNGTCDISGFTPKTGGYDPILQVKGGTSGGSVVLEAVNDRLAVIDATGGGFIDCPIMGDNTASRRGYIQIRGIKFVGGESKTISLGDNGSATPDYAGYVLEDNEITGMDCRGVAGGGNYSCVEIHSFDGPILRNNYCHDNIGHTLNSADHWANFQLWAGQNPTVEYNTLIAGAVYGKASNCTGHLIRYNYIDVSSLTAAACSALQDCAGTDSTTTGTSIFEHNVLIGSQNDMRETTGSSYFHHAAIFRFNTIVIKTASASGGLLLRAGAGLLDHYGNIYYEESTSGDRGFVWINDEADNVFDYNHYYNVSGDKVWKQFLAPADNNRNSYTTLATFITGMGGGIDANSADSGDPLFVGSGAGALFYQLQGGSPCKDSGKSNGLSGGTTCDKGAWGGATPPTRIGCDF
jgi:hypothetical protein